MAGRPRTKRSMADEHMLAAESLLLRGADEFSETRALLTRLEASVHASLAVAYLLQEEHHIRFAGERAALPQVPS